MVFEPAGELLAMLKKRGIAAIARVRLTRPDAAYTLPPTPNRHPSHERFALSDTAKKIVLLVGATVLTLAAGEILLRVVGYGTITPQLNFGVNTRMSLDQGYF